MGTHTTKIGLSSDATVKEFIQTRHRVVDGKIVDAYDVSPEEVEALGVKEPIKRGMIEDFDAFEKFLNTILTTKFPDVEDRSIAFSHPIYTPKKTK